MTKRFGWCLTCTPEHKSGHHGLCRHTFTTGFGVKHECDCPHEHKKED